jgi:hypothetical protein
LNKNLDYQMLSLSIYVSFLQIQKKSIAHDR